jgi:hypothetical protein
MSKISGSKNRIIAIVVFLIATCAVITAFLLSRSEEGPLSTSVRTDDGVLELKVEIPKKKWSTSPREPVRIHLTLTNVGSDEVTLTFNYRSRFDFMIYSVEQGSYSYMWSYEFVQGTQNTNSAWTAIFNYSTLEAPEVNTVTLKPGDSIDQWLEWNQKNDATGPAGMGWLFTEMAPKGVYQVEGYAGHGNFGDSWTPENPLRYFDYTLPGGKLVHTVIKAPRLEIVLG